MDELYDINLGKPEGLSKCFPLISLHVHRDCNHGTGNFSEFILLPFLGLLKHIADNVCYNVYWALFYPIYEYTIFAKIHLG